MNRAAVLLIAIILLISTAVGSTAAFLITKTDPVENTFEYASVSCEVTKNPETGYVQVKNTGTIEVYIRAVYVVNWLDLENNIAASSAVPAVRTAIWNICHCRTILYSCIYIIFPCFFTVACTFDKGNLTGAFRCFYAHDLSDFFCDRAASDRTLSNRGFSLYDRGCKTGTSCITTSTAVISRKNL